MSALAWYDGQILPLADARLPMDDPALLSGTAVFETIRVDAGRPVRLDAHLSRLATSSRLYLPPPDFGLYRRIAHELARGDARLKLVWTGRTAFGILEACDRTRMYADVHAHSQPAPSDEVVWGTRKHTSRLSHVLRLQASGADEVLLHRDGHYTEGTWSAILGVVDGALHCETMGVLPSITAAAYRAYASRDGIVVVPRGPPVQCRSLYVASSLRELCPVVSLDGRPLSGWEPVGIRLRALSEHPSGD